MLTHTFEIVYERVAGRLFVVLTDCVGVRVIAYVLMCANVRSCVVCAAVACVCMSAGVTVRARVCVFVPRRVIVRAAVRVRACLRMCVV